MAVKAVTLYTPSPGSIIGEAVPANCILALWLACANGDTGAPFALGDFADACVQVDGTFGAGGTVVIQGSNDGTNWFTLNDIQAATLSKTAAALEQIAEMPFYIRPSITAGDGTTAINVRLFGRRGRI